MKKYRVYRNLHNGKLSLMDVQTNTVVGHADSVQLCAVNFRVGEAGRQRVIKEGRKNVHAFIVGCVTRVDGFEPFKGRDVVTYDTISSGEPPEPQQATYNPYLVSSFVNVETKAPVMKAATAYVTPRKILYVG